MHVYYVSTPQHKKLLTDISYLIRHHVFIVVDSGEWNISLVAHGHNVQFLKSKKKKKR